MATRATAPPQPPLVRRQLEQARATCETVRTPRSDVAFKARPRTSEISRQSVTLAVASYRDNLRLSMSADMSFEPKLDTSIGFSTTHRPGEIVGQKGTARSRYLDPPQLFTGLGRAAADARLPARTRDAMQAADACNAKAAEALAKNRQLPRQSRRGAAAAYLSPQDINKIMS